jgi:hypothetical protein
MQNTPTSFSGYDPGEAQIDTGETLEAVTTP